MDNYISSDFMRGNIDYIVLRSLEEGDKYGYEIIKEIEIRSKGEYIIKQPTLYSCLKRLDLNGYITSFWGQITLGGRRKYYKLTEKGREYFEKKQTEWEYSNKIIDKLITKRQRIVNNNKNDINNFTIPQDDLNYPINSNLSKGNISHVEIEKDVEKKDIIIEPENSINPIAVPFYIQNNEKIINDISHLDKENVLYDNNYSKADLSISNYNEVFDKDYKIEKEYKNVMEKLFNKNNSKYTDVKKINNDNVDQNLTSNDYDFDNIKINSFSKENAGEYYKTHYVFYNKFKFIQYLTFSLLMLIHNIAMYFLFNVFLKLNINVGYYITCGMISILIILLAAMLYFYKPQRRLKIYFDFRREMRKKIFLFLILTTIFIIAFFIIDKNLFFNLYHFGKVMVPLWLLADIILLPVIALIMFKFKAFYIKV